MIEDTLLSLLSLDNFGIVTVIVLLAYDKFDTHKKQNEILEKIDDTMQAIKTMLEVRK